VVELRGRLRSRRSIAGPRLRFNAAAFYMDISDLQGHGDRRLVLVATSSFNVRRRAAAGVETEFHHISKRFLRLRRLASQTRFEAALEP